MVEAAERSDRLGRAAALLTWLAVGVPVALRALAGEPVVERAALWWPAYLAYGVAFWASDAARLRPGRLLLVWSLAAQVVLGLAAFALAPAWGFTAVLLVLSAASVAEGLRLRAGLVLVAVQSLVVLVVVWLLADASIALTMALVFGGFQVFAVLTVEARTRESEARQELALANAELLATRALLSEASRATERLHISRELHDLLGHRLTALALELEGASHKSGDAARDQVLRARDEAKDLLNDVRGVVGQLREPPTDLAADLRRVTEAVDRPRTHLRVPAELVVDDPERARAVLRCVQEVVTNALRHAHADNVWIEVAEEGDRLVVRASDDGRGVPDVRPGHGLTGMRERFEALGGEVRYRSAAGAGFSVQAVLPT